MPKIERAPVLEIFAKTLKKWKTFFARKFLGEKVIEGRLPLRNTANESKLFPEPTVEVGETSEYSFPDRSFDQAEIQFEQSDGMVIITVPGISEERQIDGTYVVTKEGQKIIRHADKPHYIGYSFELDTFHFGREVTKEEAQHEEAHKIYFSLSHEEQTKVNDLFIFDNEIRQQLLVFAHKLYMDKFGYITLHFIRFLEKDARKLSIIYTSNDSETGVKDRRIIRITDATQVKNREVVLSLLVSELISHMVPSRMGIVSEYDGPSEKEAEKMWALLQTKPEIMKELNAVIFSAISDSAIDELIDASRG